MLEFEENLGLCFLQLPPTFGREGLIEPLFEILAQADAATVITDVAGRRDVLHSTLTSNKIMLRLIGNDGHPSDFTRLSSWAERLALWTEQGVTHIECFIHEPEDRMTPEAVGYFIEKLNQFGGFQLESWKTPLPLPGQQIGLFEG